MSDAHLHDQGATDEPTTGADCCGTVCHVAMIRVFTVDVPTHVVRPVFIWSNGRLPVAVDPDPLHRPPSGLPSL